MAETEKNKKSDAALREERILEFWRENKIFEKTLKESEGKKEFIFYEGPPTANAKPALHHLEARVFKDAIPRYKTMQGYHVRRKGGWDTHGLPVEIQVEKKLGLNSKKAIEEYGVAKFNQECRESVWEYLEAWNKFTERVGYWVDQENAYATYHNDYIESVWNVVKKVDDQKLLYKDYKVVPWCPRCGTALSSHELAQGYEEVKDLSVYVKFKLASPDAFPQSLGSSLRSATPSQKHTDSANMYFLAWTTTSWTLPGNVALAVGEKVDYVKVKSGDEIYILAKARLPVFGENPEVITEMKGKDLVGLEYEPLFPYLKEQLEKKGESTDKAFRVYAADFVNTEDGTGIVHTAVMYGQDDFELGTKVGLPKHHLVDPEGKFIEGTGFLGGRFVREKDDSGKPTLDVDIIKYLTDKNLFFDKENYQHSYPHCWRCKTALIYYARDSWYIKMSDPKIKKQLINENKNINWEPAHTREGRFGEWLREIKDWAISRERYWGTPLPVWTCEKCEKRHVVGGLEDLQSKTKKSGNKYFIMRHGEAINNAKHLLDPKGDPDNHLTEKGKKEAISTSKKLKDINPIFSSPFLRTKETAEVVKNELGLAPDAVLVDDRLHESNEGSEDIVRRRMAEFIYEIDNKYQGKNILIVSHGNPLWVLQKISAGSSDNNFKEKEMLHTGEMKKLDFIPLPHNENYELDLHRPYIDGVHLVCDCGGSAVRTKEVMDVWLDSGCMPFAQDHYPFENKKWVDGKGYPADFISEAIDQTRGWFYTLHAVGVLMGRGKAYKNVICLGHLLDANGKKMSKSLGNIVNPWEMIDKYGVDTLRLWMYSVNQPGESKNFDEKTVALLHQQVFGLLYNVLAFYELYRNVSLEPSAYRLKPTNVLDQWIIALLNELVKLTTDSLYNYKLLEPTRAIKDFIGDLSTWYLRRSRERIKEGDGDAKATLYFILKTLAKIMAPFTPFAAEDIWRRLKTDKDVGSVHLAEWPLVSARDLRPKVLENMAEVRKIVSLGLEARQKAKIQVRQPLAKLELANLSLTTEYIELIKDELNVKEVSAGKEFKLITELTHELKQEGSYRELLRAVQDMRKKMGLTPSDMITLSVETDDAGKSLIQKFEQDIKKIALASKIEFKDTNSEEVKIGELVFKVKIDKV